MYHVSAQGVDERMINVHYYYYYMWSNCPKAYKASSNVLKEIINLSKEKYTQHVALQKKKKQLLNCHICGLQQQLQNIFCQYCLNARNLYARSTLADINGRNASTSQRASAIWTEVKERLEATRGGNLGSSKAE